MQINDKHSTPIISEQLPTQAVRIHVIMMVINLCLWRFHLDSEL